MEGFPLSVCRPCTREMQGSCFPGTEGAYSQAATVHYFGENCNCFYVQTFRDAMEAIEEGAADFAVLPIENSTAGSVDEMYDLLVEFDLVMELGRLDAPGRPLLFGTTEQFLRTFGVGSLEELPELTPVEVEEFKEQAEQEAALQLET